MNTSELVLVDVITFFIYVLVSNKKFCNSFASMFIFANGFHGKKSNLD